MDAASAERADALLEFQDSSREIFGRLSCGAILRGDRPLEAAAPEMSLYTAVNLMWWRRVGALPVLEDGRLVGCLAEEDLLRVLGERLEARGPEPEHRAAELSLWDDLLADVSVRDAMTPVELLPVVGADTSLLTGLHEVGASDPRRGRYLFLVDESHADERMRLVSFRDVARYLTALYDDDFPAEAFASPAAAAAARRAVRQRLDLSVGEARRRAGLGHAPNRVPLALGGAEIIHAMWVSQRGYVIVTQEDGGPIGICTRHDVLRAAAPRFAALGRLRLANLMSPRVKTVTDTDTLCGLFKLMALESCRHMPLVDEWDALQCVISMWEAVCLMGGIAPKEGADARP